jgi:plastocyanin
MLRNESVSPMLLSTLPRSFGRLSVTALVLLTAFTLAVVPAATAQPRGTQPDGADSAVTIQAQEYQFNAPDSIAAGVTNFSFQNVGGERHFAQFFQLNAGVSADDLYAALANGGAPASLPLVTPAGGGNVVPPGDSQQFTLNMTPGSYVLLCFVTDPDDPTPHALKGMFHPFQVLPSASETTSPDARSTAPSSAAPASDSAPPAADLNVTAQEFTFNVPAISAGQHTVQFTNAGTQPHEMTLLKVVDDPARGGGADAADASVSFQVQNAGGLAAISPGTSGWTTLNFTPGLWMMVCYVPDPSTGDTHATLGMVHYFQVQDDSTGP